MTFDPFRDMRDGVPSEPSPDVERRPPAPWIAVVFAVAMVMVIAAGWCFGSTPTAFAGAEHGFCHNAATADLQ
jgi:hypothetical protein